MNEADICCEKFRMIAEQQLPRRLARRALQRAARAEPAL